MRISDNVYNILKWICLTCLPLISSFIFGLGELLNFDSHIICGIIALVTTLIGGLIGVSTKAYNKEKEEGRVFDKEDKV